AGYAAGISSADSFTRSIQNTTSVPVGTINWGAWQAFVRERIGSEIDAAAKNMGTFDDAEGFACFERFVGALQQGSIHQVLCMGVSDEVQSLMNCNSEDFVTLAAETPFPTAALELRIEVPHEHIAELKRVRESSDLDGWFSQLLFYQLNRLVESSDHSLPAK